MRPLASPTPTIRHRIMTVHPRTISRSDAQGSDTATSQHGPTQGSHEPRRRCRHRSGSPHRPVPGSRSSQKVDDRSSLLRPAFWKNMPHPPQTRLPASAALTLGAPSRACQTTSRLSPRSQCSIHLRHLEDTLVRIHMQFEHWRYDGTCVLQLAQNM